MLADNKSKESGCSGFLGVILVRVPLVRFPLVKVPLTFPTFDGASMIT